jgi:major membrane immunogen (membrane-anchored lipoprotein)
MKKMIIPCVSINLIVLFIACSVYRSQNRTVADNVVQDLSGIYKDGLYMGTSRASYIAEPYWGIVQIRIENGSFTGINFMIRDSNLHETFNENYEKHFQGNPVYIQQCREDWKGVQEYPKKLAEAQNPDKVDAISGATWSHNIFQASLKEALKSAKR